MSKARYILLDVSYYWLLSLLQDQFYLHEFSCQEWDIINAAADKMTCTPDTVLFSVDFWKALGKFIIQMIKGSSITSNRYYARNESLELLVLWSKN